MTTINAEKFECLFNLVCNKKNWKDSINSVISIQDLKDLEATVEDLRDSVIFYTGSCPVIRTFFGWVSIKAEGYYAAVGS
jgi:hypothetical protein